MRTSFISAALLRLSAQYSLSRSQLLVSSSSRPVMRSVARTAFDGGGRGEFIGLRGSDGGDGGDMFASARDNFRLDSGSNEKGTTQVRVVSYNVLSPPLARTTHFKYCDAADLIPDVRLARVLYKLEEAILSNSIICLQEVSLSWCGPLHTFFARRRFHLIMGTYGNYFNGYMGVGIAFPTDKFDAEDINVQCLSDATRWPKERPASILERATKTFFGFFTNETAKDRYQQRSPWLKARDRKNVMIFARLRARATGTALCVGTYHMPCAFKSPPIMLIHSALAVATFQRLSRGVRGVLAGDFNIKPYDSMYEMITTGSISPTHPDFPPQAPDGTPAEQWFPRNFKPMRSAYAVVNGKEPDFTNYARVGDAPEFIDTLDYLFCTAGVEVLDVLPLPNREDVDGPFPVKDEPSDHIMIGATFSFPPTGKKERAYRNVVAEFDSAG